MPISQLRDRLQRFVTVVFDGNVFMASKRTGIEGSTLHRILEGKVTEPRISTVEMMADAMGVPVGWLLGELSAEMAQPVHRQHQLPESYWLIVTFFRRIQRPVRARIMNARAGDAESKKLIKHFENYGISPFDGFPDPLFQEHLLDRKQPTARDLALVRSCMMMETEALEYAANVLRQRGANFQAEADGRTNRT